MPTYSHSPAERADLIEIARAEYREQGVLATDTYMALSAAGWLPEALIESFEEGETE